MRSARLPRRWCRDVNAVMLIVARLALHVVTLACLRDARDRGRVAPGGVQEAIRRESRLGRLASTEHRAM
jgi:hypothetical protein